MIVVPEIPESGSRLPGRHESGRRDAGYKRGVARRILIAKQREWRYLAGPVARGAMTIQYRRDIVAEIGLRCLGEASQEKDCSETNDETRNASHLCTCLSE